MSKQLKSQKSKKVVRVSVSTKTRQPRKTSRATPIGSSSIGITGSSSGSSQLSVRPGKVTNSLVVSGREFITSIPRGTATEAPGLVYYQRGNVSNPVNTRLSFFASIFERWKCIRYRYHFISALPTTTPGTLLIAQEPDPTVVYPASDMNNINRLRATTGSQLFQAWQTASAAVASFGDYTSLWCLDQSASVTEGDRLDQCGQLLLVCVAPTGVTVGASLGTLELEYEIEFFAPRLSSSAIERVETIYVPPTVIDSIIPPSTDPKPKAYVLNNMINAMKTFLAVSENLGAMARNSKLWAETKLALDDLGDPGRDYDSKELKAEMPDDAPGVPTGNYITRFVVATSDVTLAALTVSPITMSFTGVRNQAYAVGRITASSMTKLANYTAPNGTIYTSAWVQETDFGISKGRGYHDDLCQRNAASWPDASWNDGKIAVFFDLTIAGTDRVINALNPFSSSFTRHSALSKSMSAERSSDGVVEKESDEQKKGELGYMKAMVDPIPGDRSSTSSTSSSSLSSRGTLTKR